MLIVSRYEDDQSRRAFISCCFASPASDIDAFLNLRLDHTNQYTTKQSCTRHINIGTIIWSKL